MNGPDHNPKTRAGGMNKLPMHLVPPRAIAATALAFADGGVKYRPYNWREERISASVYYGAALRHLTAWWEREDFAEDSEAHHLAHACACLMMLLDTVDSPLLNDNRPPSPGGYSMFLEALSMSLPALRARPAARFDVHDIPTGGPAE